MSIRPLLGLALCLLATAARAQAPPPPAEPRVQVYKRVGEVELRAHVFEPTRASTGPRSAIVLFHGGGWNSGDGTWMYGAARHYASLGLVAVAVDYRLSDEKTTTPVEAMEDARDAIRWVRAQAAALRIDTHRVAAYGVSAGGHLAAAAAMVPVAGAKPDPEARPDALVLTSPAVAISNSGWARHLLLGHAKPEDISPDQFIRTGLPPTFIAQGEEDSVTPFAGAVLFSRRMQAAGNVCELRRYSGVGHLLSRKLDEQEWQFDPDPVDRADATRAGVAFLAALGFLEAQAPVPDRPEAAVRTLVEAFNAHDAGALMKHVAEDVVWLDVEGERNLVEAKGREALRTRMEGTFKKLPSAHIELNMLATNGAFVSLRERMTWKTEEGEDRSQNALAVYEVAEGMVRRAWYFPAQK